MAPSPELGRGHVLVLGLLLGGGAALLARSAMRDDAPDPPAPAPAPPPRADAVPPLGPPAPPVRTTEGVIAPRQFLAGVLAEAGLARPEVERLVRALRPHFDPVRAKPGDRYRVDALEDGRLGRFEYVTGPDARYLVYPGLDGAPAGHRVEIPVDVAVVAVEGEIESSLWVAFEASGESPLLAAALTEAFQFDIDFFHDTRKGDRFRFFVDKHTVDGELVRYGRIHAAEYVGGAGSPVGTKRLYWYEGASAETKGYFDASGKAAQRAFLRSPLEYTRVSSGFGYRRHPIHGHGHFHGGVDYAAPIGTPVRAVADGTVTFAGIQGGAGKMVKLRHVGGYESMYLHLSTILVKAGAKVSQSSLIGKVGSTGSSTGPHLDFRLKKDGRLLDPRKQVAPRTLSIPSSESLAFVEAIRPWVERLGTGQPTTAPKAVASREDEPAP